LKKSNINIPPTVLTIDQCQGQEADAVVLSMVQKPTRFLNKNRLNVALSRVRKELYVLIDTNKLKEACNNRNWDAAPLANEMITYHKDW
jgi:superfamily I DNA and/or RNA helicase